jgi:predicted Zn-dependent protease
MKTILITPTLFLIILASSCTTNNLTGKSQLAFLPEKEIQSMSADQYKSFISKHEVLNPAKDANAAMVQRVSNNISRAVERYFKSKNTPEVLNGYNWEYKLVRDSAINAWCMPGGKVVVYTGILPVSKNENALAIVLGHEVSHALLQHGNQRMSQSMIQQFGGVALSVALANKPAQTQDVFLRAYGVGTEVGFALPFSRKHELEADRFGLIWAVMAGYDPNEAIAFWERMENISNGQKPPELLSTHPSDATRKKKIKEYLPEALKYKGK